VRTDRSDQGAASAIVAAHPTVAEAGTGDGLSRAAAVALVRSAHPAHVDAAECAACGSPHTRPSMWQNGFRIAECDECGFLWVDPMPTPAQMWEYYNRRHFAPYTAEVVRKKYASSVAFTSQMLRSGSSVLDVGCNHGHFAALLRDRGYDVAGIDIDGAALAYASDRYQIPVYQGDLAEADIGRRFDAVTILSSLEHATSPYAILRAAARVIRPGGTIVISTPRADGLIHVVSRRLFQPRLRAWEFLGPPSHLTYFSRGSLTAMLSRAGFDASTAVFGHQERDAAYTSRELANTLDQARPVPVWMSRAYPLLAYLRLPARAVNRGTMMLCAMRTPAGSGSDAGDPTGPQLAN
jgi:SAM-dependent methyltransferase